MQIRGSSNLLFGTKKVQGLNRKIEAFFYCVINTYIFSMEDIPSVNIQRKISVTGLF